MKIVSVIPARGGSKEIPRKNLVKINGHPLISYTIKASLKSNVNETWVSSDDNEILDVASSYGAHVLKRPAEYATDTAASEEALLHFADNVDFDILVFMQATSPLTSAEDINKGIELMSVYDSVISVSELTQFVWSGSTPSYDLDNRKRRQDNQKTYLETGAFFITSRNALLKSKNRISGNIGFTKVPKLHSFDIDTYDDLEVIKRLMS
jgi:N-acylneuraminate cytidylyltransferase